MNIMKHRGLILSLVAIGAALAAWHCWTGTIYYSLLQIRQAVEKHDRYLFEQHVDVQSLSRRLVDDFFKVTADEVSTMQTAGSGWEQLGLGIGMALIEAWKPRLVEQVSQGILRSVESGTLKEGNIAKSKEVKPQELAQDKTNEQAPEIVESLPKVKPIRRGKIRTYGNSAIVELVGVVDENEPEQSLRFRLVRTPDRYWRVTEFENFSEILAVGMKKAEAEHKVEQEKAEVERKVEEERTAKLMAEHMPYLTRIKAEVQEQAQKSSQLLATATGSVQVRFTVKKNGELKSAEIARSSGDRILEEAALQIVRDAAPFEPFPASLDKEELELSIPLDFTF